MSHHPAFHPIADMEDDILAVARWAGVLNNLGTCTSSIDPGQIWVISHALTDLGRRLDASWNQAFDAAAERRALGPGRPA
ncbi:MULTISPECIES: hypothetical protein [unclassified Methylobacterium]|uniref:hypothetical protein n=1 Tax=unclassified Methylobacterium TaxID=2615210 RepID=UPI002269DAF0|nr:MULTISPECIES: hypothetical protein [unclassified Methylobacterium]